MNLQGSAENRAIGSSSPSNNKNTQYRIVIDTSVLISAFFFGGKAKDTLLHIADSQHMIVSDYIIEEFVEFTKSTIPKTPQRIVRLMRQTLEKFAETHQPHSVEVRDSNDIAIMQLALEYEAVIVTSDKDMLEHKMGALPVVVSIDDYCELFIG